MKSTKIKYYEKTLAAVASLSKLSSDSATPYIGYRQVENIFCIAFDADNLSRSDCSADASKNGIGIGIKTFLNANGRTLQKIAEFNKDTDLYRGKTAKEIVKIISKLRNDRIQTTKRIHNLNNMIYHCVAREPGELKVFECNMDDIDIANIKSISTSAKNTITFQDGINEYSFNLSKSTLYKRFITPNICLNIKVTILNDPYTAIRDMVNSNMLILEPQIEVENCVYLPLFSDRGGRHVPMRSGLNQWNAEGRARDANEIYIPIPSWIHKNFPDFFPSRNQSFYLRLPDGSMLNTKVCQDGGKALMSNPNLELGQWLLRTVMDLKEKELLTYEKLEDLGLDSVIICKDKDNYTINFTEIGSYDTFYDENK